MANDPEYDLAEARAVFERLHYRLKPEAHLEERSNAALALVNAVLTLAGEHGCTISSDATRGQFRVSAFGRPDATFHLSAEGELTLNGSQLPIEYDPAARLFVGKLVEKSLVPMPGEHVTKRRNAVAVVAELVEQIMAPRSASPSIRA